MRYRKALSYSLVLLLGGAGSGLEAQGLSPKERLGRSIFFDRNLSINGNQACADCHAPAAGWTGPDSRINAYGSVYEGSIAGRFGNRKPPSSAYATLSPILHAESGLFTGGNFWDGRATGEKLGNPAADQAQGPFLNPLEQALASPADVVSRVCAASYRDLFKTVWGGDVCDPATAGTAYDDIALSIAAFEASPRSNAFTSKYDYYVKGQARLSRKESEGLTLFKGQAQCGKCHTVDAAPNGKPSFTNFGYDNIGVPRNPDNPFYTQTDFNPSGDAWVDKGLGGFLATRPDYAQYALENDGKQKVPTLRNVDKRPRSGFVKAYGHNGYFKSLKGIVHFYNTRDVKPACDSPLTREADALVQNCWPAAEVPVNVNVVETGNLHLTGDQEDAIVAFLKTLSDGYKP